MTPAASKTHSLLEKIDKTLSGLKFAVVIISIFTVFMIVGTFLESYFGTEFANRLLYKRWPFMLVQFTMLLSILFATFNRLPFKKRLSGFYIIHLGLILLFCGSFITWYSGLDGHLTMLQGNPNRTVELPTDQLKISYVETQKIVTKELPLKALESDLNLQYEDFKFESFLPFSENILTWKENKNKNSFQSSKYLIKNDRVSQDFILSTHPDAIDFDTTLTLGPLNIHYLPHELANCFGKISGSKLILWDSNEKLCFTPEEKKIAIKKTSTGKKFLVISHKGKNISFFPDFSPWPLGEDLQMDTSSSLRIFSKELFEKGPHLFLFGDALSYFHDDVWSVLPILKEAVELPWMGFTLTLQRNETTIYPTLVPTYTLPIQKNGKVIKGDQKAVKFTYRGESYWLTDQKPLEIKTSEGTAQLSLGKENLVLPFEMILTRFKMDVDPGTKTPASYESFVHLFSGNGGKEHHVFMNNPLKFQDFTFYQASYFKDQNDQYGSVLSVNIDPGRAIKYFGSILLILGCIIHYNFRYGRISKNFSWPSNETIPDGETV